MSKCRKCKVSESTGFYIALCDPCFDEWEASTKRRAAASPTGSFAPNDRDIEYIEDHALEPGYRGKS